MHVAEAVKEIFILSVFHEIRVSFVQAGVCLSIGTLLPLQSKICVQADKKPIYPARFVSMRCMHGSM